MKMPDSTRLNLGKPVSPREIAKNQARLHGDQPDGAHIADSPLAGRHSFNKDSQ
jgi:hypothetical protein